MATDDMTTIKVTVKSRQRLRFISGAKGEKHYEVIERLLEAEERRVKAELKLARRTQKGGAKADPSSSPAG